MSSWTEDIKTALINLGGIAPLKEIYDEVKNIRKGPYPKTYEAVIRGTIELKSSDSEKYNKTEDLFYSANGVGYGVWGLREIDNETPEATDIHERGNESPNRVLQSTYRVLRDTELSRRIKLLHKNRCQLCNQTIQINSERNYSEAHHIIPLGKPHNGPDTADNIIIVCPNHHVMLDFGLIILNNDKVIANIGHEISEQSIKYHNEKIYQKIIK